MSDTPLVHLENIVLRFGEKTVLDGIDLKVFSRDRLVILGQSGGGGETRNAFIREREHWPDLT